MSEQTDRLINSTWLIRDDVDSILEQYLKPKRVVVDNKTIESSPEWKDWIRENYERGCSYFTIGKILEDNGFKDEDIIKHMDPLWGIKG